MFLDIKEKIYISLHYKNTFVSIHPFFATPPAAAPESSSAARSGRQFFTFGEPGVGLASGHVPGYPASTQPLTVMPVGTQPLDPMPSSPFAAALCFTPTGQ
jgi:hypothetical protein